MALLAVQNVAIGGLTLAFAAAGGGGDEFVNTGKEIIHVHNASGGSIDVDVDVPATVDGLPVSARTVTVGAGARVMAGPFPPGIYNDGAGKVQITYTSAVSVTIAVIHPGA